MKLAPLFLATAMVFPSYGETVYTIPQGYTKITIPAGNGTSPSLTAISATLLRDVEFSGSVAIAGDFSSVASTQSVSSVGAGWTTDQWIAEPYLAFVSDGTGEEAFRIMGNTAETLTLETSFDLTADSVPGGAVTQRFPSTTTIKVRKAVTLGSFFGTTGASFGSGDVVYAWNGTGWESYIYSFLGFWALSSDDFTDLDDTVIFPDEGLFVSRVTATPVIVTLFGEVPSAPQINTIEKASFVSSRYPVGTTLAGTGINNASWGASDVLYIWNSVSNQWDSFIVSFLGHWSPASDDFDDQDAKVIPANSAIFVVRGSAIPGQEGGATSPLPYDPFAPDAP